MVRWATCEMLASASPRNPYVAMLVKSVKSLHDEGTVCQTFSPETVFKIIRWKIPSVPTESTFLRVESTLSLYQGFGSGSTGPIESGSNPDPDSKPCPVYIWYRAVFMEKRRIFQNESTLYGNGYYEKEEQEAGRRGCGSGLIQLARLRSPHGILRIWFLC